MEPTAYQTALRQAMRGEVGAVILDHMETEFFQITGQMIDELSNDVLRQLQGRAQALRLRIREIREARKENRT